MSDATKPKEQRGPRPVGSVPVAIEWTPEMDAKLTELRSEGISNKNIARQMKLTEGPVARRARVLALPSLVNPVKPRAALALSQRPPQAPPLRDGAVTLATLPSLHQPLPGYVACSPNGSAIPATLRATPDDAWRALRASITEPDVLADKGWHVCRCMVLLAERLPDSC